MHEHLLLQDLSGMKRNACVLPDGDLPRRILTGCSLLVLSADILQGWESIRELILAKAPAAAKPLVQYILRCKIRPNMAAALRYQVGFIL